MARLIVRDPDILSGRWRIEDTLVSVAMIREEGNLVGRDETMLTFEFMGLTLQEYEAVMDFEFPDLRGVVIENVFSSVIVQCACGEDTPALITDFANGVPCICGRKWKIRMQPWLDPNVYAGLPG
jgi:uncharacterized protein (DUF433 family)